MEPTLGLEALRLARKVAIPALAFLGAGIVDTILKIGGALAGFSVVTLIAWGRLTQKVADRLQAIETWQSKHGSQADARDLEITNLKIRMAVMEQLASDIRGDVSETKTAVLRLDSKLDAFSGRKAP